jgi:hypothetical protein
LGIEPTREHPRDVVTPDAQMILHWWQQYAQVGHFASLGGASQFPVVGPLPFSGGYAEQPAIVVAAFQELTWASARLRETRE